MVFKINVSHKGKTKKYEIDNENLVDKIIGDTIKGEELAEELAGYELEITGTSDKAGFPGFKEVQGPRLKKLLLKYGKGMHKRPKKEGKFKISNPTPKGLKLRKTVRGNTISLDTVQINTKVSKQGTKKFDDLFKPAEEPKQEEKPEEAKQEEQKE